MSSGPFPCSLFSTLGSGELCFVTLKGLPETMSRNGVLVFCGLVTAALVGIVRCDSLTVSSCGDTENALVKVKKFEYSPNPVTFPGNLTLDLEFDILQDIVAPVSVNTAIEVGALGGVLQIPCINGIGSCFIDDICEKITADECPDFFKNNNIQCQCPFQKGSFSLPELNIYIPLGDCHVTIQVHTNDVFAFCLDIRAINS
ncbi:hypothetical protein RRG08_043236 [Elysia crispata]|uniref:MD-2-related lipid-recognition domain-containing protein n=1 Tax=Elysia crispata TaxID=231223 RepID=A0AAE0Y3Q4_9GAST|nr:hypothetical protein RRG08_043236 [Elysia crispata]